MVNKGLVELGRELGLPLVATNYCHYLKPQDARAHDVLLCIQTGKTINTQGRMQFQTDQLYFKSAAEMAAALPYPAALAASGEIASRCHVTLELGHLHFPVFPAAAGESMAELLRRQAREGLKGRLAGMAQAAAHPEEHYWQRLEYELDLLDQMGFAGYFLVVSAVCSTSEFDHRATTANVEVSEWLRRYLFRAC